MRRGCLAKLLAAAVAAALPSVHSAFVGPNVRHSRLHQRWGSAERRQGESAALWQTTRAGSVVQVAAVAGVDAPGGGSQRGAVQQALEVVYAPDGDGKKWEYRGLALKQAAGASPFTRSVDTGDLTYGEFDVDFFCRLVEMALPQRGDVFLDVGSGNGRLAIAAASMLPLTWSLARGVEIVPQLHESAESAKQRAAELESEICPLEFVLADIHERLDLLTDVDVCFCYSTAFSASGPYLSQLSATFGLGLREGARVITVDKMLLSDGPWQYEAIGSLEARNREVGTSTGYVYRVVKSPHGPR